VRKLLGYMAMGNLGTTIHLTDAKKHPRGQLLRDLGKTHAKKVYSDSKEGVTKHVGYIVGKEWFTLYEVREWIG